MIIVTDYNVSKLTGVTVNTKQAPINPYGKAKKMAEDIILDYSKTSDMAIMILRFVFYASMS